MTGAAGASPPAMLHCNMLRRVQCSIVQRSIVQCNK